MTSPKSKTTIKTKDSINFLDLDAVLPPKRRIKLNDEEHVFKPATFEDFLEVQRLVEESNAEGDSAKEFALSCKILAMSFPTVGEETFRQLTVAQITALQDWARKTNGIDKIEEETKAAAEANPPASASSTSGSSSPE